ncbi:hypothetical protein [Noviherbaspirillum galbum]|uniref:Uncharacterized protein n=1 Tax=Noviherbaspirillum galbum TaxID=2709383 RepID=A0A6B3SHG5_9BURK|nr:hypothetical protein [Noviherbaspirillum galbum]NEX60307.1 hypothetical protein [Noviherbaspirillum galbum]
MSAVREQEKESPERSQSETPESGGASGAIEIREGDWRAYRQHVGRFKENKALAERFDNALAYKRACALAYLGRRAQLHGGVCSTRHPHIMTPQLIADLESSNRAIRYARYPWLRALMNLLQEIEQIQDQISPSNVLTLVPGSK